MRTQRQVVDYSLQKRALLRELHAGRIGVYEVCDASPYLKNAARFHGEPTERPFGTRTIHLTQFFLLPGAGYKFAELGRQARVAAGIV